MSIDKEIQEESRTFIEKVLKEAFEIESLLKEFGFVVTGFDPGVSMYTVNNVNDYFSLDGNAWYHIKPLLEELRDFRLGNK